MPPTIAIIAAGAMGAGVAQCLTAKGVTVLTSLAGRSPASVKRATEAGMRDAVEMTAVVAAELGVDRHQVLVCSTGLIGIPMPMEVITPAIRALVAARSADGGEAAATAIMTTDTHAKQVVVQGDGFTVGGMAKGAAMLSPNMATMLAVLTTDAAASPEQLKAALFQSLRSSSDKQPRQ